MSKNFMNKAFTKLPEIHLVGITARTNNAAELLLPNGKASPNAKITQTVTNYMTVNLAEKIIDRKSPGTTYCVYYDYESDYNGDYTFFIGEQVTSFKDVSDDFTKLTIPAQNYVKFTNGPGILPSVCIEAWNKIWSMSNKELGGKRNYQADFEVYDNRAWDPQNAILDIYIGIER